MPDRMLVERTYGSPEAAIIQPERQVALTAYNVDQWLPRLGVQRWALVQVLRRLALDAPQAADGTRCLEITRDELARRVGIDWPGTIGEWLKSEPIPGRRGWRRIMPKDEASEALAHFIPRLRYTYERGEDEKTRRTGLALYIRMDEPLTPEDEARLPEVAAAHFLERMEQASFKESDQGVKPEDPTSQTSPVKVENPILQAGSVKADNPISHQGLKSEIPPSRPVVKSASPPSQGVKSENPTGTLTNELDLFSQIEITIQSLEPSLTDGRRIRGRLTPIVKATEELLADYHSTQMLYKVLTALYRVQRLELYVQALGVAVEVGELDAAANLGAVFVSEIKRLGRTENVDVGLAGSQIPPVDRAVERRGTQRGSEDPADLRRGSGRGAPALPDFPVEGWSGAQELWQAALRELSLQMTMATFDTWLRGTWIIGYEPAPVGGGDPECFVIQARSAYAVGWLTHRLSTVVVKSLSRLLGRPVRVEFVTTQQVD